MPASWGLFGVKPHPTRLRMFEPSRSANGAGIAFRAVGSATVEVREGLREGKVAIQEAQLSESISFGR